MFGDHGACQFHGKTFAQQGFAGGGDGGEIENRRVVPAAIVLARDVRAERDAATA